jgi:hypothetical protein
MNAGNLRSTMPAASSRSRRLTSAVRLGGGLLAAGAVVSLMVALGWHSAATGVVGVVGMTVGCVAGLAVIRWLLSAGNGVVGVARAVVEEALRMRAALALLAVLVAAVPTLPLVLDHSERLHYRVQFLLQWALGGAGVILGLLTIFLACGTVCGDIDTNRIHMTFSKPLRRWEYLLGKWLGIVVFDLLLVALAGAGTYTFVRTLAATPASDAADRAAVDRQVLAARAAIAPGHESPAEFDAAVAATIAQREKDDPAAFARGAAAIRDRIRWELEWLWHTVTPDMISTFVFTGLAQPGTPGPDVQLQLRPRATNVDVDMADVRFALWVNERPWPVQDGRHVEQTLASGATHVIDIPGDAIGDSGTLKLTIANRNLVPAGETRATAITFPPGDGLRLYRRVGGFEGNFLRCLGLIWAKLALVAAVGVAAGTGLGFPTAALLSLLIAVTALGSGFLRDALGSYNVVADSAIGAAGKRLAEAAELGGQFRLYEAFRMLLGFVADAVLWIVPSFADFPAVSDLAAGIAIPAGRVLACGLKIGVVFPALLGLVGWAILERRDLVRSAT